MPVADESQRNAVVLFSGGLDSSTVLAMAVDQGYQCYALSFDYGQRHTAELKAAKDLAAELGAVEHRVMGIDFAGIGGSALTDKRIDVPAAGASESAIPVTYVPARNTVFLSMALGWAEVLGADAIFIGVNAIDYSGYPDCRPEFVSAFRRLAQLATRDGVEGRSIGVETPLISLGKDEIIRAGDALGVDYGRTISCYQATDSGLACGNCDACVLRRAGFVDAGIADPTPYV